MSNIPLKFQPAGRRRCRRSSQSTRRGAATVEFALVAPILFLLIFACFEFTRVRMMTNLAQDAAYVAARHSMVDGATSQEAIDKANAVLKRLYTRNTTVVVNDGQALTAATKSVTVRVSIPLKDNSFVMSRFSTKSTITAEVTLTAERYAGFYNSATP